MIGICFFVEARQSCGLDLKTHEWLSICETFEVDRQMVIDCTGKECFSPSEDANHPAEVFGHFNEVIAAYPDAQYVMVERAGEITPTPLPEYDHPDGDVIYCFGPDSGGISEYRPPKADWVIIPMPENTEWGLWAITAASIVMNDRWVRGNT